MILTRRFPGLSLFAPPVEVCSHCIRKGKPNRVEIATFRADFLWMRFLHPTVLYQNTKLFSNDYLGLVKKQLPILGSRPQLVMSVIFEVKPAVCKESQKEYNGRNRISTEVNTHAKAAGASM